ncbi:MAG: hypothetical protein ACD_50C00351G0003 [uncultured bacterium]|nr:MAG: hypothetical protein ACD_50C00351G0003 [uncultured bacterium]
MSKVVKTQSKGMVTIPVEFRQKLGINENSLMEAKLIDNGVVFIKLDFEPEEIEIYSDNQIKKWMEDDKIDTKTAKKLEKLLKD